ncbi:30S ribosomal protein S8e [Natronomonas salsuginis]|jgi:small subunit ribosomal protein S8e|uniref:Small ribosomal subunit protein eS8 n=1 Tax=Natronomonas salsuginis TaxID=2217661 RepID=A0A4U5JGY9_9EURY|nr:30S ribosomal protein S8e [Natronomonas salsuginis]TKR27561.1 30S ribosomal protein S8e [Natronomonas salsuginis]
MNHARSTKKRTGGRRRAVRKKRKHELGSAPTETQVGDQKLKTVETQGGNTKVRAVTTDVASVSTNGGVESATIEDVVENASNPNYVRRNIITKGAIIETDLGRARVTSRPGQDGQVNAVLLDE